MVRNKSKSLITIQKAQRKGSILGVSQSVDPTRTQTMRRQFATQINKQFALLKGDIVKLVLDEDALGLGERESFTFNVFCPTGKGGGVDPSCGTNDEGKSVKAAEKAVSEYLGISPKHSGIEVLSDKDFDSRFSTLEESIHGGIAAIRTNDGKIYFKKGYEGDAIHELTHAAGTLPTGTSDYLNEGVTQSIALAIGKKNKTEVRSTYETETKDVENYIIPATGLSHQEFAKGYAAAIDKGEFITSAIWKKYGDKFSDTSDWGQNPKEQLAKNIKQFIGPGPHLSYLVDELKISPIINYDPSQPRDTLGRFSGIGSSLSSVHKQATEAVAGIKRKVGENLTAYIDKAPGGKKVRETLSSVKGKMEERYGPKTAGRIFATANAISWGAFAIGPIVGYPNYIPASGLMVIGAALAEAYQQGTRAYKAITGNELSERLVNVFCPTGQGGGVDPSCSPSGTQETTAKSLAVLRRMGLGKMADFVEKELPKDWKFSIGNNSEGTDGGVRYQDKHLVMSNKKWWIRDLVYTMAHELAHAQIGLDPSSKDVHHGPNWQKRSDKLNKQIQKEYANEIAQRKPLLYFDLSGITTNAADIFLSENEVRQEALGIIQQLYQAYQTEVPTENTRWKFHSSPEKLKAFQAWIKAQLAARLRGMTEEQLWKKYIEEGYRKGAGRAFDDVRQAELKERRPDLFTDEEQASVKDFYAGTKQEFLRSSFAQPVSIERVQMLASRTFDDLKNMTEDTATKMGRILTDSLVQGKGPREVARELTKELDIGRKRALVIARTELIRAHAEGQLQALDNLGVEEVGAAVEWSVTKHLDGTIEQRVCDKCRPLDGIVLTIAEARGMLPRHPQCRCAWKPANVGEKIKGQKRTKTAIDDALKESGLPAKIAQLRPQSIFNHLEPISEYLNNVFCKTGKGGGIDPSCSPGTKVKSNTPGEDIGSEPRERPDREIHHLGVNRVVMDAVKKWKYKGEVEVKNQDGRQFERGGIQWTEGGNCHLESGKITIHSGTAGESVDSVQRLTFHELMHGTFEKVHQKFVEERTAISRQEAPTKSGMKIKMDGTVYPEYEAEAPTYARIVKVLEGTNNTGNLTQKFITDDGITDYSKAYWKDYQDGKTSFHIAVHETLAEMAAIHETTGKLEGSKVYKDLYKAVRNEYQVLTGTKSKRTGPDLKVNELFQDTVMYFTADFKPTSPENAYYIKQWDSLGNSSWGVRADTIANNNPKGCNQYTGPGCSTTSALKEKIAASYDKLHGPNAVKMKAKEKKAFMEQYRKDIDALREMEAAERKASKGTISPALSEAIKQPEPKRESQGSGRVLSSQEMVSGFQGVKGSEHNLVHLGDYRESLGLSKQDFEKSLLQARLDGKIVLKIAEGRHGLTERDKAEAIKEADPVYQGREKTLLYAALRLTSNVFCPTGKGGGVDPSCSPQGKSSQRFATTKEAEDYLVTSGIAGKADLGNLHPRYAEALVSGLENGLAIGNKHLRLKLVSYGGMEEKDQHHLANYQLDSIKFSDGIAGWASNWLRDKDRTMAEYRKEGGVRNYAKEEIGSVEDAFKSIAAHEAGHHVEKSFFLDLAKATRETGKHTEDEVLKVSGYATINQQEKFAEIHAFVTTDRGHLIPTKMIDWYKTVLATADPDPINLRTIEKTK